MNTEVKFTRTCGKGDYYTLYIYIYYRSVTLLFCYIGGRNRIVAAFSMTTLFETEIIASFISVAFRGKRAAALAVSERLFRLRAGESGNMTKPFRHI